jgi:D-alanyl-D-alanine dipeptidase
MKKLLMTYLLAVPFSAQAQICPEPAKDALKESTQLIVTTVEDWNSSVGKLRLWQRKSAKDKWKPASGPLPAVIGIKGTGWGFAFRSLANENPALSQPIKHEGDGRSPAGVFPLGLRFGFDSSPSKRYLQLTESTVCVDDLASSHYNSIVDASTVQKDWSSGEEMRKINEYRHGAVIDYGSSATEKAGSCIFFHIWSAPDKGTSGCTAVAEDTMAHVQKWLNDNSHAAILLAPKSELSRFSTCLPGVASMDISM